MLLLALLALPATTAFAAEEECDSPSPECAVVGKLEISAALGIGQRSNPVAGKSDIPLVVVPHISYYGKRFFLENLEIGFTLHEGGTNTFNLIAAPGYDRVFFHRNDLQNIFVPGGTMTAGGQFVNAPDGKSFEVEDRDTTYLAGPEWTFGYGRVTGQITALREVTGEHDGSEVRAALAGPLVSGRFGSLTASAGFTWKSAEVVRYYYGVDDLYEPDASFSPFVKLRYSRQLSDRWSVNAFAHYEHLSSEIADSPIVSEDHVTTVFAGVVFRIR